MAKKTRDATQFGAIPFRIDPDGRARVLGLDAATRGAEIRDRVGYMPEQEAFLAGMTAVELCSYAGELSGLPRTEAMQRAHAALPTLEALETCAPFICHIAMSPPVSVQRISSLPSPS